MATEDIAMMSEATLACLDEILGNCSRVLIRYLAGNELREVRLVPSAVPMLGCGRISVRYDKPQLEVATWEKCPECGGICAFSLSPSLCLDTEVLEIEVYDDEGGSAMWLRTGAGELKRFDQPYRAIDHWDT